MKKILGAIIVTAFIASFATAVRAADEQTIKGEALCTKCELHETAKCSTAIRGEDGTLYYAENNDVAKAFHKEICKAPEKVVAHGVVKDKDGKKVIVLSKIEAR
ncbi:MAG TPA: DUF6370 family protein [Verrucomicrobiae bacterium]|jgi:hypothetical protein|nr:DUF6370 family protein [Verrucomicrobiae bacterium]